MGQSPRDPESSTPRNGERFARRVLLVGWEGAELATLQPLLHSGRLSHLASLLEHGARLELTVPRPANAPSAWTSLATGCRPHRHGILHSLHPDTQGGLQPVTRLQRQRAAIWNVASAGGLRTHVVGWPVTFPAEPIAGACVSDSAIARRDNQLGQRPTQDAVSPAELEPIVRSRQISPSQIDEITLAQILPREAVGLATYPQLSAGCRSILAEAATLFRVFRWCLDERPWGFAACIFPGLRRAHELAHSLRVTSPEAVGCAEALLAGCYEHHDMLLGQLLQQVGSETYVVAVSLAEHGAGGTPASGLAAICGPKVSPPAGVARRSVLDLAPTILAMLGVPCGDDLDGRPWLDLIPSAAAPGTVTSWEFNPNLMRDAAKQDVAASAVETASEKLDQRGVEHLIELGYVDPRETAARGAVRQCERAIELNRANSLLDAGEYAAAISVLERVVVQHSESHQARALLAEACFRANQPEAARCQIDWLRYHGNEQPQIYFLAATIEYTARQYDNALAELQGTARGAKRFPGACAMEGDIQLRMGQPEAARAVYASAIELEGASPHLLSGLAAVELLAGRFEAAAVCALDALATDMRCGRAHYQLGVALLQLDKPNEALQAFETWAAVEPRAAAPYRWIARVHERQLGDECSAAAYRVKAREVVRHRRELRAARVGDTSRRASRP